MRVSINGVIQSGKDANYARFDPFQPIINSGWSLGDGIFETIKVMAGEPFALNRHLNRLYRSSEILKIAAPAFKKLREDVAAIILSAKNEVGDSNARLRITLLSSGEYVISLGALAPVASDTAITLYPFPRNENSILAGIKTISYGENAYALRYVKEKGFDDALFFNLKQEVVETTVSNVMWERSGEFFTSPLSSGCLPGITRELLVEFFNVSEVSMSVSELEKVDAIYLLSSVRDIQPVARFNSQQFSKTALGEKLIQNYSIWMNENVNP